MNAAEGGYSAAPDAAAAAAATAATTGFRSVMLTSPRPGSGPGSGALAANRAWYSFPETMLRALLDVDVPSAPPSPGPSPSMRLSPSTRGSLPTSAVPIILLVPVSSASLADLARPVAMQVVAAPTSAVHRRAVAVTASDDVIALRALPVPAPALQGVPPAQRTDVLPHRLEAGVHGPGSGSPWRSRAPRSWSMSTSADSDESESLALPSFGERTAAAKQMLSAAPGGPVRRHSPPTKVHMHDQNFHLRNQQVETAYDGLLFGKKNNGKNKKYKKIFCPFCLKNGETYSTFHSHPLSKKVNGIKKVMCPQLRQIRCPICEATGDNAHTISYCPEANQEVSVAVQLRRTLRRCDGSIRTSKRYAL